MLWASNSCNVILEFYFKQSSVVKNMNIQQALFILKKDQAYKTKKIINISYLIMVLIKMRLLIFLVLSRYGLACKYRIISQISIYNWIKNCILRYFWYYYLLRQVKCFVPWWVESIIISSDILHRTSSGRQLK